jgi:hypothetical protein
MNCGDTFLMPAQGGRATPHLWILVTNPDAVTRQCAIVSVTTPVPVSEFAAGHFSRQTIKPPIASCPSGWVRTPPREPETLRLSTQLRTPG